MKSSSSEKSNYSCHSNKISTFPFYPPSCSRWGGEAVRSVAGWRHSVWRWRRAEAAVRQPKERLPVWSITGGSERDPGQNQGHSWQWVQSIEKIQIKVNITEIFLKDSFNVLCTLEPIIRFLEKKVSVSEPKEAGSVATVKIPVVRLGDTSKVSVVRVHTKDGSAVSGEDYHPVSQGELQKKQTKKQIQTPWIVMVYNVKQWQ